MWIQQIRFCSFFVVARGTKRFYRCFDQCIQIWLLAPVSFQLSRGLRVYIINSHSLVRSFSLWQKDYVVRAPPYINVSLIHIIVYKGHQNLIKKRFLILKCQYEPLLSHLSYIRYFCFSFCFIIFAFRVNKTSLQK